MDTHIVWSPGVTLEQIEKMAILMAYKYFKGNKTTTASALRISINTLASKLDKYLFDEDQAKKQEEQAKIKHKEFLDRQRGYPPNAQGMPFNAVEQRSVPREPTHAEAAIQMSSSMNQVRMEAMQSPKKKPGR